MGAEPIETNEKGICLTRYDLSDCNFNKLKGDYLSFEHDIAAKLPKKFIKRIIRNFFDIKKNEKQLPQYDIEMQIYLKASDKSSRESLEERDRISLDKKVRGALKGCDFSKDENFKKRVVIDKILSDFCEMEYPLREKIYFYDFFRTIQEATDNMDYLTVEAFNSEGREETLLYKPYRLAIDDNSFSYYICGCSKLEGETEFKIRSTRLSNIIKCDTIPGNSFQPITKEETKVIENRLTHCGIAYIKYEVEHFKVWLTHDGRELFRRSVRRQRPTPNRTFQEVKDDKGKCYYELEFDCSYRQIRNYFFSFGKSAIIIEPPKYKDEFLNDYNDALKNYEPLTNLSNS